ncbi:MAG TPA: LysR family transcriptional regulator [Alphaproteobacteria bacterium]|jgi:DNA-binding transcriptional LysR family regulator|nr:LysR family transcriptional regulator [Alphaproteobacteria bacterium]
MDRYKLMETFESVVRLNGYTPAAKELGVTRAMVSKRILELEGLLNVKLLTRTTQRIGTTAAGVEYYRSCAAVLADVRVIEERLMSRRRDVKGELRVLSSRTFGETVLAPLLARFCTDYPGIRPYLALRELGSDEHDLISRGFDVAIRPQQVNIASLVARPLAALPRIIVATPAYVDSHGMPKVPTDLSAHNCLMPNGEASNRWEFTGPRGRETIDVSGSFRSSSNAVIRHAVLAGLGIGLVGAYIVDDDLASGRMVRLLEGYRLSERTLYALYQKDRYQPRRVRLFIDFLSRSLKGRGALAARE